MKAVSQQQLEVVPFTWLHLLISVMGTGSGAGFASAETSTLAPLNDYTSHHSQTENTRTTSQRFKLQLKVVFS